jgi:hypothetical protein
MTGWQAVARTDNQQTSVRYIGIGAPALGHRFLFLRPFVEQATSAWKWVEQKRVQQIANRRLKVAETVSLGEKRFVSILQVDGTQFLIGGAAGNVSLLAILDKQQTSSDNLWRQAPASTEVPS